MPFPQLSLLTASVDESPRLSQIPQRLRKMQAETRQGMWDDWAVPSFPTQPLTDELV